MKIKNTLLLFFLLFILGAGVCKVCTAGTISRYFTYSTGDDVTAINLNGNFDNIVNEFNGGLDNQNANTTEGFWFIEVLGSLPAAGNQGRVVFLTTSNSLWFDTGATWLPSIVYTGTASQGDIFYYDGTNWVLLNKNSTNTTYLNNQGTNNNPSWGKVEISTGLTIATQAQGDIIAASTGTTWWNIPKTETESHYLSNQGTDNAPQWEKVDISTGLDITGQTQGDIIYYNGSQYARLGAGTEYQYLKSTGPASNPEWDYASFSPSIYSYFGLQYNDSATVAYCQVTGNTNVYTCLSDKVYITEAMQEILVYVEHQCQENTVDGDQCHFYINVGEETYSEQTIGDGTAWTWYIGTIDVSEMNGVFDLTVQVKLSTANADVSEIRNVKLFVH